MQRRDRVRFASITVLVALLVGCGSDDDGAPDMSECPDYNTSSGAGSGGACTNVGEYCGYFEAYCHCNGATHTWYCCTAGVPLPCPTQPPSGNDCCRAYQPLQCSYACSGGRATYCTCSDDRWQCSTVPCD